MLKNYLREKVFQDRFSYISNIKKSSFLIIVGMLMIFANTNAQTTANYSVFTGTSGSFTADRNGNTVNMSTGTTQIVAPNVDDNNGAGLVSNIGFDFFLYGNRYTQFSASDNGLIGLGATAISPSLYTASGGTTTTPRISAFCADLQTGTSGKVHYKLVGTVPNRCLVIEFLNMSLLYVGATGSNDGTFQVRLYETSGIVELMYGAMSRNSGTSASASTVSIGLSVGTANGNTISMISSANTFTTGAAFNTNTYVAGSGAIPNLNSTVATARRFYTFIPPGNSSHLVTSSISSPTSLTFTSVSTTGMTLNWAASSPTTGVLKYAIYNSIDNVNFTYVTSVLLGTNTYVAAGLTTGTTYYWRVFPLSEGKLGTALAGSQITDSILPCIAPNQATAFVLGTITASSVPATFTASVPAASGYLIIRSNSSTPPSQPVNGTTYSTTASLSGLGTGLTFIQNSNSTTIPSSGLTSNTQYYYYIYAYNNTSCSGGPIYKTGGALIGNGTTCLTAPTSSAGTAVTNSGFTANWATVSGATGYLLDVSTNNTFSSFLSGYNGLVVAGGSTISQIVTGLSANTTYYYRVRATNATACTSVNSGTQTVFTGYCTPTATTGTAAYLTNFSTAAGTLNINNTSGFTTGAYQDNYATMAVSKYATGTINYAFTLATSTLNASVAIWVDWNNNLIFETSEKVFNTSGSVPSGTYSGTITVPSGTAIGDYRLRIKSDYSSSSPDACVTSVGNNAETEDYKFTVIAIPDYDLYTTAITPNNTVNNTIDVYFKDFDAINNFYTDYTSPASIWMYAGVNTPTNTFDYIPTTSQDVNNTASLVEFVRQSTNPNLYKATIKFADYFCIPSGITVRGIDLYFRNKLGIGGNNQTANLFLDLGDATVQINAPVVAATSLITTTTATINWTAPASGTIKGYEYYYSTSSTAPTVGTTPSGSTFASIVNAGLTLLTPSTLYYVWVRTKSCGSEKSAWSASGTFTTLIMPPLNDDLCSAISLTIGATCTYATYTNAGATATTGVPTPGCASYSGGDVWFKVIVPSTGALKIDTQTGVILDSGMAIYSSSDNTCSGTLTLIECDDDDSNNGAMSMISLAGLTSGATLFVRVFEYANDNNGTFGICVTEPPIVYCVPSSSAATVATNFITNVSFLGTLNDTSNNSTNSSTSAGYENFTGLATHSSQIQGEPINVSVQININSTLRAWVDWNRNGVFTDSGETVFDSDLANALLSSATFGFVVPNVSPGDYRIRIRTRGSSTADSCTAANNSDTEDYIFTVIGRCVAEILTVTDAERCGPGNISLAATGNAGVQFKWYTARVGGSLLATTASGSYTPNVTNTTSFYVTAFNGTCETQIRKEVVARVKELADITLPSSSEACGDTDPIVLTATAGTETVYLISENFENGFGNMSSVENGTANAIAKWRLKTGPFKPSEGSGTWLPVISSGFGTNSFATATSDIGVGFSLDNSLQPTSAYNTNGFINLTLKFRMYFSRFYFDNLVETGNDEFVNIEISTNGGSTWLATPVVKYVTDIGNPGNMANITLNLNAYINQANLKFRIRYKTQRWTHGLAVDDIQLYGDKALVPSFTWSGAGLNVFTDVAMTLPYTAGTPASTVYAIPDISTLGNASFNINVSTTVTNGCTITKTINVTNKSKVWTGSASADWNNPSNWSPSGIPNNTACIIIPNTTVKPIVSSAASGKNISIRPLGELLVNSNNTLTINDAIDIKSTGKLTFENNASLVQVNENPSINSGDIVYKRNTSNMLRYSYTYWSSPVFASTETLVALSPSTLHDKYFSWNTASQSWLLHDYGNVVMQKAKGYIVRAPQTFPISGTAASYNAIFNGVPNNGLITIPTEGSTTANKWNLLGNPYPSALNADLFLANTINPGLEGTIYLWTNFAGVSSVPNPQGFYPYTPSDYATYNLSGGTATAPGTVTAPGGLIAAGQAFFVKGISAGSGTATFNNTMRKGEGNNQFFKNATTSDLEKNRFWINLENTQGSFHQILVGYIEGATTNYDRGFDGEVLGNAVNFYSIIPEKNLTIQGKGLPFEINDIIKIGYKATIAGNHKFTLDHFDNLFTTQNIYIKDKLLNIYHDIKNAPYSFVSAIGTFEDRFEIVYQSENLGVENPIFNPNSIVIYKNDKTVHVNAGSEKINELKVFDIQGRLLYHADKVNNAEAIIKKLPDTQQVLIIQVSTENGNKVSKKLLY